MHAPTIGMLCFLKYDVGKAATGSIPGGDRQAQGSTYPSFLRDTRGLILGSGG
jgi:hypothetical protein